MEWEEAIKRLRPMIDWYEERAMERVRDMVGATASSAHNTAESGHDFHERTKEQAARDKERDRIIQTNGLYVLRFTGSEVYRNCRACVEQVDNFLREHIERRIKDEEKRMEVFRKNGE